MESVLLFFRENGIRVKFFTPKMLKRMFPYLNTDDIILGSYGAESEGWCNPYALMCNLRMKCEEQGVTFIHGDVHNVAHKINADMIFTAEQESQDEEQRMINDPTEVKQKQRS